MRFNTRSIRLSTLTQASRLALCSGLAVHGASWAQSDQTQATQVQTVEVTAQLRRQPLQEVPAAVSALNSAQLEDRSIVSTQDMVNRIPNMSLDTSMSFLNSFVTLRGVTQINNADSPLAIVVDGVPQSSQKQFRMNLFDVQRVEVLKGPQGALYGRNAIGGAVNIVTKKPTEKFEGFAGLSYGNGNDLTANAGASGALLPGKAYFRLVAQTRSSDGLIENTFLNKKTDAIDHDNILRGKLSFDLGADLAIDVQAGTNTFRAGAVRDSITPDANNIQMPRSNILGASWGSVNDLSVKADWQTSLGTVTSITALTKIKENFRGDIDFSNPIDLPGGFLGFGFQTGQGQNLDQKMTSQEFRLTSPDSKPIRYIFGAYWLKTRKDLATRVYVDANSSIDQYENLSLAIVNRAETNDNRATAVFGQFDFDLGSKDLTLSAGLRHDRDERNQTDVLTGGQRNLSFSSTQPKVTLSNKWGPNLLAYATYSTGFRSGGFNAPGLPDFAAEKLTNYEIGAKQVLAGGSVVLNTALFEAHSRNFQFFYVNASIGAQIIGNIDRVRIRGLDLDAQWKVTRDFEVDGGIGLTDSIIQANSAEPDSAGKHTPKNMPMKLTLGAQQRWNLGSSGSVLARLDLEHRSKKYFHPDNVASEDPMTLLNARIGWSSRDNLLSTAIWGKNLTNHRYYADVNAQRYSGLPYMIGSLAEGRSFGIEGRLRF